VTQETVRRVIDAHELTDYRYILLALVDVEGKARIRFRESLDQHRDRILTIQGN
jgi:hypothetical protein